MNENIVDTLSQENAKVLAELIVDPATSDHTRVAILNKLMEIRKDRSFFETMLQDNLSLGECPCCGHQNHWLIPEDILNQMGWVTAEQDGRVRYHTTSENCEEFMEACQKRKSNI